MADKNKAQAQTEALNEDRRSSLPFGASSDKLQAITARCQRCGYTEATSKAPIKCVRCGGLMFFI